MRGELETQELMRYLDTEGVSCYWTEDKRWWFHATPPTIGEILDAAGLPEYFAIIDRHILVSASNFDTTDLRNLPITILQAIIAALVAADQHKPVMRDGSCHRT